VVLQDAPASGQRVLHCPATSTLAAPRSPRGQQAIRTGRRMDDRGPVRVGDRVHPVPDRSGDASLVGASHRVRASETLRYGVGSGAFCVRPAVEARPAGSLDQIGWAGPQVGGFGGPDAALAGDRREAKGVHEAGHSTTSDHRPCPPQSVPDLASAKDREVRPVDLRDPDLELPIGASAGRWGGGTAFRIVDEATGPGQVSSAATPAATPSQNSTAACS
jgi:hypothetical protein